MIDFIVYAASQSPWLSYWALPSLFTFLVWSRVMEKPSAIYYKEPFSQWIWYSIIYPLGIVILTLEVITNLTSAYILYAKEHAYDFFYEPISLRKESKND